LTSSTKRGSYDRVKSQILVCVWHDDAMVLCTEVGLHSLAVLRSPIVNVLPCSITSDETDSFDARVIADGIDCRNASMNNIEDAIREASLLAELGNDHGGARVTLRRFEDECVAGDRSHWDRPEGNHPT
jgi:hypothetical protein